MAEVIEDRRAGSRAMIRELVGGRDCLLKLYRDLAELHPFHASEQVTDLLERFCQALIDYTADAHFRLYRYIDERRERRRAVLDIADEVYPAILSTTDIILKFNDRYDFSRGRKAISLETLEHDLSLVGERLADRIELEDRIIQVLGREARAPGA